MKRLISTLSLLAGAAPSLFAQDEDLLRRLIVTDGVDIAGEFFMAVIAGVVIAFATQYLLTALSVAIGISAVPNLKKTYAKAKAQDDQRGAAANNHDWNEFDHEADDTPTGVMVSSAAGAWNLVTTAVALFTGAAFALTLVPALMLAPQMAVTVALVIWGVFFILLFWLESRFASTIVGSLISAATSGLKAAAQSVAGLAGGLGGGVASLVTPSPTSQVKSVAESTIKELDNRFGDRLDSDRIVSAIEEFTQQTSSTVKQAADDLGSNVPSYKQLKSDIREIAVDAAEKGKPAKSNPAKWTAIQSVIQSAINVGDDSDSADDQEKTKQLKQLLQELKTEYDESGDLQASAKTVAKKHVDDEQLDQVISQVQDKIKSFGGSPSSENSDAQQSSGGLNVETLQKELKGLFDEQGSFDTEQVKKRLSSLDRGQIVTLIASNSSLSKEQVEQYAGQAEQALTFVQSQFGGGEDTDSTVDVNQVTHQAQELVAGFIRRNDPTGGKISDVVLDDGNLDLSKLKRQLVAAISGSGSDGEGDTLSSLSRKLKNFDKQTVIDLLTDNTSVSKAQLADYGRTLDESIAEVQDRVNRLGSDSQAALRQAERRAAIEAEHARKAAASAAWWLVLCIVVSGVAAVGGALLGGL